MKAYRKEFPEVGEILFERSKKAKRINISVRPERGVRVAVPYGFSFRTAEKFAKANLQWIQNKVSANAKLPQGNADENSMQIPREEGKRILIQRLEKLSHLTGLGYNRVFIKNQKTLWGSCSCRKNINLNIQLLTLPEHLRDYVILHELVHTKFLNHSKDFWNALELFLPECRNFRKELRQYRVGNNGGAH